MYGIQVPCTDYLSISSGCFFQLKINVINVVVYVRYMYRPSNTSLLKTEFFIGLKLENLFSRIEENTQNVHATR